MGIKKEALKKRGKMNKSLFSKRLFVFLLFGIFLILIFVEGVEGATRQAKVRIKSDDQGGAFIAGVTVKFREGSETGTVRSTVTTDGSGYATSSNSLTVGLTYYIEINKTGYHTGIRNIGTIPSGNGVADMGTYNLPLNCIDSDGGPGGPGAGPTELSKKNAGNSTFFLSGTAPVRRYDACVPGTASQIKEWYCDSNYQGTNTLDDPINGNANCPSGTYCITVGDSAKCVFIDTCSDSDNSNSPPQDGEISTTIAGEAKGTQQGQNVEINDDCSNTATNPDKIKEGYCLLNQPAKLEISCPTNKPHCKSNIGPEGEEDACVECVINSNCPAAKPICSDEACVECVINSNCPTAKPICNTNTHVCETPAPTCTDSDGGSDDAALKTAGSAVNGTRTANDECSGVKIYEAICLSGAATFANNQQPMNCPSGTSCKDEGSAGPDYCVTSAPTCIDNDGDGYGDPGNPTCASGGARDCNDNNGDIFPGASETCNDGVDNDCNGIIDTWGEWSTCCTPGANECSCTGSQTRTDSCGYEQTQSCLVPKTCPTGQSCSDGVCSSGGCTNDPGCNNIGAKRCSGNINQTCGNYDPDSCLEWTGSVNCPAGQTCSNSNGACVTGTDICGDNERTGDEICDFEDGEPKFKDYGNGNNKCNEYDSVRYSTGDLNCTSDCQIDTDQCEESVGVDCETYWGDGEITTNPYVINHNHRTEPNQCPDLNVDVNGNTDDDNREYCCVNARHLSGLYCSFLSGQCEDPPTTGPNGETCVTETTSFDCSGGVAMAELKYNISPTTCVTQDLIDSDICTDSGQCSKQVACPQIVPLNFFSWMNFITALVLIAGIYAFIIFRENLRKN